MTEPWVVVGPNGVLWLGYADCEIDAWRIALGGPYSLTYVEDYKRCGWYAAPAQVTWKKPT